MQWNEVDFRKIGFNCSNAHECATSMKTWFPYNKGGESKWYGGNRIVVKWFNNGEEIKLLHGSTVRNEAYYFLKGITFPRIGSSIFKARVAVKGSIFDINGPTCYSDDLSYTLGLLNSNVMSNLLRILCPTITFQIGDIFKVPYLKATKDKHDVVVILSDRCIELCKEDWDAHETSWDFLHNELLSIDTSTYMENIDYKMKKHFEETGEHINLSPAAPQLGCLEWRMEQYKTKWERKFMQLHKNEEELNRQFIDIYGLQDELTPDVPLNEITILQQGEINVGENGITWNEDAITKQLISYAVGCMLGRYRLDRPGLHIAHPNPTDEEIAPYEYNGEQWEIDDDGIMPLMPNDCGFSDNASARFADFIRVALGNEEHVENLNYVEKCLGKPLEQYFVKDFWKDHKKMYQNRPIYWLFSSKKGAFQVIAYMHRMNAYTAERVRSKYLLPYIEHLESEIDKLDARRAELSTKETKQLQALQKQLDECREYHERLQVVAEQAISFDLDDGVIVNYAKFGNILQKIK